MAFKLYTLLALANHAIIDGYEVEYIGHDGNLEQIGLRWCGGDERATFKDREVELNDDGDVSGVDDTEGNSHDFSFKLEVPLTPKDVQEQLDREAALAAEVAKLKIKAS